MAKTKPLAQQFADAEAADAQRHLEKVRADYFADRMRRIRAGEEVEPLVCVDSNVWQEQLNHERILRDNMAVDRLAGLVA